MEISFNCIVYWLNERSNTLKVWIGSETISLHFCQKLAWVYSKKGYPSISLLAKIYISVQCKLYLWIHLTLFSQTLFLAFWCQEVHVLKRLPWCCIDKKKLSDIDPVLWHWQLCFNGCDLCQHLTIYYCSIPKPACCMQLFNVIFHCFV